MNNTSQNLLTPRRWLAWIADAPLSPRGLAVGFLGVAAYLTLAGWIRPPLSTDLRSLYIPIGWTSGGPTAAELLQDVRRFVPDGVGVLLLAVIGGAAAVALWQPGRLGAAASLLLAVAVAGNAAAAFNHPLLVQELDYEFEQRQQMGHALASIEENAMPNPTNGRLGLLGLPAGDEQAGDLQRGLLYLLYGRWLVLWAAIGVLCGTAGSLARRLGVLGAGVVGGLVLSAIVCFPRLHAEHHWMEARRLESEGALEPARRQLDRAVALFPAFAGLDRTWLLLGKLDHLAGRNTPQQRYFLAFQLHRDKMRPRALTMQEDLAWVIPAARDYRMGLASPPSAFNAHIAIGDGKSGTPAFRKSWSVAPQAFSVGEDAAAPRRFVGEQAQAERAYRHARVQAPQMALGVLEELLGTADATESQVVRRQMSRIWSGVALAHFLRPTWSDEKKRDEKYYWRDGALCPAQLAWRTAGAYDPHRRDCRFYHGLTQARLVPGRPAEAAALLANAQENLGDQILAAEMLTVLGDAYFAAGQVETARQCYARSFDMFCLPKVINTRAQERLGGR